MCEQRCHHYQGCGHLNAYDYIRCSVALARPDRKLCMPASGSLRDLPRALDIQDQDLAGLCPPCSGLTPPSSQGSQ